MEKIKRCDSFIFELESDFSYRFACKLDMTIALLLINQGVASSDFDLPRFDSTAPF